MIIPSSKKKTRRANKTQSKITTNNYTERQEGNIELRVYDNPQKMRCKSKISGKVKITERPEDMPIEVWNAMVKGEICGARRSGLTDEEGGPLFCRNHPLSPRSQNMLNRLYPYRCKFHGGANLGSKVGNKNRQTHGIYSAALLKGEEELLVDILGEDGKGLDDLGQEIIITKVRLYRALKAEASQHVKLSELQEAEEATGEEISLLGICPITEEVEEISTRVRSLKRTRKLIDYGPHINRLINQLTRLLELRLRIKGATDDDTPDEYAANVRDMLAAMIKATTGGNAPVPSLQKVNKRRLDSLGVFEGDEECEEEDE